MDNKEILEDLEYSLNEVRKEEYNRGYTQANKEKEFDPIGIENINFSLARKLKDDDERLETFKRQRIERGFDDTELWNLDTTLLKFLLPRLKEFKKQTKSYPSNVESFEEWQNILQKMIDAIEYNIYGNYNIEEYNEKFKLLQEYIFDLWW
jgi:hypothetical protein